MLLKKTKKQCSNETLTYFLCFYYAGLIVSLCLNFEHKLLSLVIRAVTSSIKVDIESECKSKALAFRGCFFFFMTRAILFKDCGTLPLTTKCCFKNLTFANDARCWASDAAVLWSKLENHYLFRGADNSK